MKDKRANEVHEEGCKILSGPGNASGLYPSIPPYEFGENSIILLDYASYSASKATNEFVDNPGK